MTINSPAGYETRWKKGQSGNPAGRPSGGNLVADVIHSVMTERVRIRQDDGTEDEFSRLEGLVRVVSSQAFKGNMVCARLLLTEMRRYSERDTKVEEAQEKTDWTQQMLAAQQQVTEKVRKIRQAMNGARKEDHMPPQENLREGETASAAATPRPIEKPAQPERKREPNREEMLAAQISLAAKLDKFVDKNWDRIAAAGAKLQAKEAAENAEWRRRWGGGESGREPAGISMSVERFLQEVSPVNSQEQGTDAGKTNPDSSKAQGDPGKPP